MRYEGVVYRPPSEAYSLIVQATVGCAHNKCTFCSMYKDKQFKIRSLEDIFIDLEMGRSYYKRVDKIFLADGDALVLKTENLKSILRKIRELFPECTRVGIYGTPGDILRKSIDELKELKSEGLGIVYLGVESGSNLILQNIKKGVTAEEMIQAGKKIKESGLTLSVTLISGLGGKENLEEHAKESAKVISEINPDYLGLLTLMFESETPLYKEVQEGNFKLLQPSEIMMETKLLIENSKVTNCVFRSNHASNYVSLKGTLPEDKENLLNKINSVLQGNQCYKSEAFRAL
ncbi:MAG: B12-binding domain-containing radical SAM protein [Clostridium lundense]|nr:B12-binding domain-containing radical SAM protein [Clostridium lundense]